MDNQSGHVMTLANSIIGVSILAMPYCFKQCGIVLSIIILLISSVISRLACHFLLKSAIIARRKTFEYLAFHIFGSLGKLAIEIGMIGFLLGTCIAFFVVMGDLGPEIISEMTGGTYTTSTMRTSILMALALFCVLPLGLLRNVDSLNGVSKATIGFYCCLVLKVIFEAAPHIFAGDWYGNVVFWRPAGILQCLPIFSMALFCQTQLFEIYQALPNATLEKMNNVVRVAVNICTIVYILVGAFGYIAFSHKQFTGNILLSFSPSFITSIMKIGFVLSVAFSFPLVIFPCRASLYSLLYKEGYSLHEGMSNYIPEGKFKGLTMFIVFLSLIIGIMIPTIELVLGLVGSTIGVMICVLFPVASFICISPKNTNERILAQLMLMVGVFVMVLGTYKNLYNLDARLEANTVTISSINNLDLGALNAVKKLDETKNIIEKATTVANKGISLGINIGDNVIKPEPAKVEVTTSKNVEEIIEVRHEPPQPIEPQEEVEKVKNTAEKAESKIKEISLPPSKGTDIKPKEDKKPDETKDNKNDEVDAEAIKKEEMEVALEEKNKAEDTNQVLIDTIQKQNEMQKEIVEQQKKLIEVIQSQQKHAEASNIHKVHEEKVKAMKQIESIALKAIETIGGGKEGEKLAADLEKHIEAKVDETVKLKDAPAVNEMPLQDQNQVADKPIETLDKQKEQAGQFNKIDSKKPDVEILTVNLTHADGKPIEQKPLEEINVASSDKSEKRIEKQKNLETDKELKVQDNEFTIKKEEGALKKQEIEKSVKDNIIPPIVNEGVKPARNVNNKSINNTAPLFLKLGKVDQKPESNMKMLPLPIAVSNGLGKGSNLSKTETVLDNIKKSLDNTQLRDSAEVQAMRRDILMVRTGRR